MTPGKKLILLGGQGVLLDESGGVVLFEDGSKIAIGRPGNKRAPELNQGSVASDSDQLPGIQSSASVRVQMSDLQTFLEETYWE